MQLGSNIIAASGISGPSRNNSKLRLHDVDADAVAKCLRYLYVALHTKKKERKKCLKEEVVTCSFIYDDTVLGSSQKLTQGEMKKH